MGIRAPIIMVFFLLLSVGCSEIRPRNESQQSIQDIPANSSDGQLGDSINNGSEALPYKINGGPVQPGDSGVDGSVSLLTSAYGDINGDGADDRAAILVLNSTGSGVFYYLNVLVADGASGWRFVEEVFLGDRITFDFVDIYTDGSVSSITGVPIHRDDYGQVVVAYSVRTNAQSFAEQPRLYLTRHWKMEQGRLIQLEDD